jgi:IS5 family transposase
VKGRAEQLEFRRPLPVVEGNADYQELEAQLRRMDDLLRRSGMEERYVEMGMGVWEQEGRETAAREGRTFRLPTAKVQAGQRRRLRQALRCNVARQLTEKEYRKFTRRLAEGALLQWFCRIDRLEVIRVPGKSTLERYEKLVPESGIRELVDGLNRQAVEEAEGLGLAEDLGLEVYLSDTTCVKANIHFPTDWVLLRDGVRTLMKAVKVIRRHGLKHRMPDPDAFLRQVNRLSMEMSLSRRRRDSVKRRKRILRQLKALVKLVQGHADRYSERLKADWRKTDLKEGQMRQIARRMDGVLKQLPEAKRQAHERIIGGRQVPNGEKILSLYERDIHVIVRNKAEAESEFGNTLFLAEQADGLILDWKLEKEISPGDIALLRSSLDRIREVFGRYPDAVGADRGFASRASHAWLEKEGIGDAICPRDPVRLKERLADPRFRQRQRRRAQTEGRIGIVKNVFLGRPLRSKGFEHREMAVTWAVLAHNLSLLAGRPLADEANKKAA